ncbi:transglutaminase family protein [Paenibacillus sp. JSM ZJ436]|uniref:transglutaminase family protein n=1 Tax=Paenibacillus sp. JSM ZJ436 TaxID=3376190 RepID=UPI0037AAF24C
MSLISAPMQKPEQAARQQLRRSNASPFVLRCMMTLPAAGLLIEWLLPLQGLGGSNGGEMLGLLFCLTGILLLQGLSGLKEWLWLPLNAVLLLGCWGYLLDAPSLLYGVGEYLQNILPSDAALLSQPQHFSRLSTESRALILLLGWATLVSAVQLLFLHRGSLWLFGGATVLYLAVLEGALELPVYGGFIRCAFWMLLAQGISFFISLQLEEAGSGEEGVPVLKNKAFLRSLQSRLLWITLAAAGVPGMLYAAGQAVEPASGNGWTLESMVQRVSDWSAGTAGSSVKSRGSSRTGYDALSGDLGGPLEIDTELVFTVQSGRPSYWRGEAMAYYSGRRWIAEDRVPVSLETGSGAATRQPASGAAHRQTFTLHSSAYDGMPIFSGGVVSGVENFADHHGEALSPTLASGLISGAMYLEGGIDGLKSYTVTSEPVSLEPPDGKQAFTEKKTSPEGLLSQASLQVLQEEGLQSALSPYLQLPSDLPGRIGKLGFQLTKETDDVYSQALNVQTYLKNNFPYTLNTTIPAGGEDFVDDFLFQQKQGYCTHFATAMTVLLRTQGIPARYVTGFAPGERDDQLSDTYRVTQQEAHAWVEVYVPEQGWTAFDPTPGYHADGPAMSSRAIPSKQGLTQQLGDFMQMLGESWRSLKNGAASSQFLLITLCALLLLPILTVAAVRVWRVRLPGNRLRKGAAQDAAVLEREQLLCAADQVWRRLAKRYGALGNAVTVKKYMQALPLREAQLCAELASFAALWERTAYGAERLSRSEKVSFLRQCRSLAKKLS